MTRNVVKEIRKTTRRKFNAEEKIRIILEGLRGVVPVSDVCRREGIAPTMYYRWSKAFLDSGKNGLTRDTKRDATSKEVRRLKKENESLKTYRHHHRNMDVFGMCIQPISERSLT